MPRSYTTFKFRKAATARSKARAMKRKYGYVPRVFREINPKTRRATYVVVKPKGLRKI